MKKSTGSRREGRILAVQLLFMLDHNSTPFEAALPAFMAFDKPDGQPLAGVGNSRAFCEELARGVVGHWKEIDGQIKQTAANFNLQRIGGVERAVLRLAVYEMLYCMETPPVVAINEALEIARRLAGDEAVRFVNGILDKICGTLNRPSRTAVAAVSHMERQMMRAARELGEAPVVEPGENSPGRDDAERGS